MKIRFYGILSNRNKKEMLNRYRELLHETAGDDETGAENPVPEEPFMTCLTENVYLLCTECQKGHMIEVMVIEPEPLLKNTFKVDSS